jgi:cytochrome oxidase assembly protein ShyY1
VRSFRFLLSVRWVLFTLFCAVLAYGTYWLGWWQHSRMEKAEHLNSVVAANLAAAPAPVGQVMSVTTPVTEDTEWRRITATGTYDTTDTLTWRYLTSDHSESGVDQVVPFTTADGTTLLVDRGWVSSDDPTQLPADAPKPPAGTVTVVGWVRASGSGGSTRVADDGFRALSSSAVGTALDKTVYDGFVDLQSEDGAAPTGMTAVDMPDAHTVALHLFYWLQWWVFMLIAIFGYGYLMREEWLTKGKAAAAASDPVAAAQAAARLAQKDVRKQKAAARNDHKQRVKAAYQAAYDAEKASKPSQKV